ncbi:glycosyltransferase [Variovorax arabinosiphilus]|uniref:glycosyltransferase n=1 Tax=Variovorax arabinosiphilus TaxID=3053498 RepID=UPI0025766236|nr:MULTISPECIES: glycosyltransferase [unclassified Variovorax]MDM0122289.1 glycosyltransferase [Variovorax sp. J2L1-78]MDM0131182.1 glycosyltransferase [Variovorax sp. J2L1-63]MDM0235052.1 glycosyltransferase [Variovorax sp. J2R1-6]
MQIYQLALHRTPSKDECAIWSSQVTAGYLRLEAVIEAIVTSPEAQLMRVANESDTGRSVKETEAAIVKIYQMALHRTPGEDECAIWSSQVTTGSLQMEAVIEAIVTSPEAQLVRATDELVPEVPNGKFIQYTFEELLGRGPLVEEIAHWDHRISQGILGRGHLVTNLFAQRANQMLVRDGEPDLHDPTSAWIMGTDRFISVREWQERAAAIPQNPAEPEIKPYPSLAIAPGSDVLVSVIASLYCGGDYIEQFLENMTSQTLFPRCELIIVDANSPENEFEVIASYMKRFPNIVYHRAATRIGIYEAWNVGVEMSRGRYLTNANLDDLRRRDSFERQAEILEKFPFVDVTYQDFYYSFDGNASVAKTATVGVKSELPIVTPYNLVRSNSPHNAPMWRREIHNDVGLFDASYRSAGDHDFWLRCMEAGKVFYKVNDPHVVYFVNPEGLSTRPNSRGVEEGRRTTKEHGRKLMSPRLLSSDEAFMDGLREALGEDLAITEREAATAEWRYMAAQKALRRASIADRATHTLKD